MRPPRRQCRKRLYCNLALLALVPGRSDAAVESRDGSVPRERELQTQNSFTLSLTVTGLGTLTLDPPGGVYDAGIEVTVTASPTSGWSFSDWSGSLASTDNPIVVTMSGDQQLGASFVSGPPGVGSIVFQEDKSGGASDSSWVTTDSDLLGVDGNLYVAAVAAEPHQTVTSVDGLGLTWSLVDAQCAAQAGTGVSLWWAQGSTSGPGEVSAQLAGVADDVVLVVARYAGVDSILPIALLGSGNELGRSGACTGDSSASAYALTLTPSTSDVVVVGAVAHLDATHTPSGAWKEREQFHHGTSPPLASLSLVEHAPTSADTLALAGAFDAAADWAAIAIELHPAPKQPLALTTSGLGNVTLSPAGGYYGVETLVSLTATPEPGWFFVGWGSDLSGHENPTSVLMDASLQAWATFSATPHFDLQVDVDGVGHVVLDAPEGRYASGAQATASVEIPTGWIFTGWSGDAAGKAATTNISVDAARFVTAHFGFVGTPPAGLWTSAAELAAAPTSGVAWDELVAAADEIFFPPDPSDQGSKHNVRCLAAAIVYARTNDSTYHDRVVQALDHLASLGNPGSSTLAWAREVGAYALAADLIGYRTAALDTWFRDMAETYVGSDGRTVLETFRERPNNWGTHAFGMLVCVYAYLEDDTMLSTVRDEWAAGITGTPADATFGELSWHQNPAEPRRINPPRARRQGLDVDGAITDDVRRGGPLEVPPNVTGYPWEALQGLVLAARVLERSHPELSIWYVGEKALFRAARLLQVSWEQQFGGWAATGDDRWMLPFFDAVYGTSWSTGHVDENKAGKNVGWSYVLAGSPDPTTSARSENLMSFRLYRSVPNPFSTSARIRFDLPSLQQVRLQVYDVLGRRVATLFEGPCPAGLHTLQWNGLDSNGRALASGVYWCQLEAGERRQRVRMTLVR